MGNDRQTLRAWMSTAYECVAVMVISLVTLVVLFTFFFRVVQVDGSSMNATLYHEDNILLYTAVSEYQRGDIVVVDRYTIEPIVKRIIAVGGDELEIKGDGTVWLNGARLHEPYAQGRTDPKEVVGTVKVPIGSVFVMGDNRAVSLDSRYEQIGCVSVKDLVGKAVLRVSPFVAFGDIYGNMGYNGNG